MDIINTTDKKYPTAVFMRFFQSSKVFLFALLFIFFMGLGSIAQAAKSQYEILSEQYIEALNFFRDNSGIKDLEKGFEQVKFIAEQGLPMAQFWLGQCYNYGWGTEKDPVQSFAWHNKAAQQKDLNGLYWAGIQYLSGDGVIQDVTKGCLYLRTAAESDEPDGKGVDSIKLRAITAYNKYCN